MRLFLIVLLLSFQLWPLPATAASEAVSSIRLCADDAQWPPFSYTDENGVMAGYTVAMIARISARLGIHIQIDQLPWKRCLAAVQDGSHYQVAIDASASPEREQAYLLSRPYYQLTPYYFYSRRHFSEGINIQRGQQLAQFGTVCGLPGYNYSNFALGQTTVYTGSQDFYALAAMIQRGRCALFIGRYEIVAGMARIGNDLFSDPELSYGPIPDAQAEPFYLLISRNIAASEDLKAMFDSAIEAMSQSGELDQLRRDYLLPQ
ncbi:MAG: transporter substrate-binding domain-containing protein [Halopseudomonas sp.]